MKILKNLLGRKTDQIRSFEDFWVWFQKNQRTFFDVVHSDGDVEGKFLSRISAKITEIKEGLLFLTGMYDDNTAELVVTVDGNVKNIVFVEELINAAPNIEGWKFTTLKPSLDISDFEISMEGQVFNSNKLFFYSNEHLYYPDLIDLTIVHVDYHESIKEIIINGTYIFLDNYLGELNFATLIDNITVIAQEDAENELIPIEKLKDFLKWRQKEFTEKYEGVRHDTEQDNHSGFEAELESGNNLLAVINTELLNWDRKASHPWISILTIKYNGSRNNGMPNSIDYEKLANIEEELLNVLPDKEGYLYIGRQTAEGEREIYFACREFRLPSKVFHNFQQKYSNSFDIDYDIYKDKYWQSFNRFRTEG